MKRTLKIKNILSCFLVLLFVGIAINSLASEDSKKMNVLFIAVDDLRTQAGIYGTPQMKTPNIDKLGESGTVFTKAYCSVPVCGASRASLLSGVYPTANRFVNYFTRKDNDFPNHPSLPKYFKNNGYTTLSLGKVYHHIDDDLGAWSSEPYSPDHDGIGWQAYLTEESKKIIEANRDPEKPNAVIGPPFEAADVADNKYPDGMVAEQAMDELENFKKNGEPFFLAVGFVKPHLPFNAPKKYWDMYDKYDLKLADNPYIPKDAPQKAMHQWNELRGMYAGVPKEGPVSEELEKQLVHGYYASVSYTDAQVGKLMKKLEELELDENTIIVLWGDHGWHLGEHGLWCKHCNFERVLNAPLIVNAPGADFSRNVKTSSFVEFIDIYPTLCDLTGLAVPSHLDGDSFANILKSPDATNKEFIYSRYHDGETVINDRYSYTEWISDNKAVGKMLYDHKYDYDENINVVDDPEYKGVVKKMQKVLNQKRKEIAEKTE
jgi:iduronate 2-sulfatase